MTQYAEKARELVWSAERDLTEPFRRADAIEMITTQRVLDAFREERVSARHFSPTNGYGYDDIGRDTFDRVFARAMQAEAALVRPQIVNGTHALFAALAGLCEPEDTILSVTGKPYDTLETALGIRGDAPNALSRFQIHFASVPLAEDGSVDIEAAKSAGEHVRVKIVYAQRSRGYAWREAISVPQLGEAFAALRQTYPNAYFVVDNCYGEFTEVDEPTKHGSDVIAGSLIKNPGGGLAPTGGYVAGKQECVNRIAARLTVPGLGAEVGSYAGGYRLFYQGLFMAPHVTCQCLRGAMLFARVFEKLALDTLPASDALRADIIQAVRFPDADAMVAFCRGIQATAPIDSFVVPEPWAMPGYADPVIMAAGAFVQGATTELSADGPLRPPYTVYLQGALTYAHARIAAMQTCETLLSKNSAANR